MHYVANMKYGTAASINNAEAISLGISSYCVCVWMCVHCCCRPAQHQGNARKCCSTRSQQSTPAVRVWRRWGKGAHPLHHNPPAARKRSSVRRHTARHNVTSCSAPTHRRLTRFLHGSPKAPLPGSALPQSAPLAGHGGPINCAAGMGCGLVAPATDPA